MPTSFLCTFLICLVTLLIFSAESHAAFMTPVASLATSFQVCQWVLQQNTGYSNHFRHSYRNLPGCPAHLYRHPATIVLVHLDRRHLFGPLRDPQQEQDRARGSRIHKAGPSRRRPSARRAFVHFDSSASAENVSESGTVDVGEEGFGAGDAVQGSHDSVCHAQEGTNAFEMRLINRGTRSCSEN